MKEYDQHLARLNKENFALKLRVYFLEEKQGISGQGAPALNKANIELKVENESLKRQLYDKQQLLSQASSAITQLEEDCKLQMQQLLQDNERAVQNLQRLLQEKEHVLEQLQHTVASQQQMVSEYSVRCSELESALRRHSAPALPELTQLCDLAFPDTSLADDASSWGADGSKNIRFSIDSERIENTSSNPKTAAPPASPDQSRTKSSSDTTHAPDACTLDTNPAVTVNTSNITNNNINNTLPATSNNLQQLQQQHQKGYSEHHHYHHSPTNNKDATKKDLLCLDNTLSPLAQQQPLIPNSNSVLAAMLPPVSLQGVFSLNSSDSGKSAAAETQYLQQQVSSLQTRVQQLQQELQQRDQTAAALRQDLENLRRELMLKTNEVVEREQRVDALQQEASEHIRQMEVKDAEITSLHRDLNRVEPEISIKVQEIEERDRIIEEKTGQIEQELENSLAESLERVLHLQQDYDKSCTAISGFATELSNRDKEIANLRRDLKKKDRKIKDLVAELKETLDMLGKAKWEAETADRGEDSIKEMVEEEHERLWAEMEQKKQQLAALSAELKRAEDSLREQAEELSSNRQALKLKEEAERQRLSDLSALKEQLSQRQQLLEENKKCIDALEAELNSTKKTLCEKQQQLDALSSKRDNLNMDSEIEELKVKLKECEAEKDCKINVLEKELKLLKNDIARLQTQLLLSAKQHTENVKSDGTSVVRENGQPTSVQVTITSAQPSHVVPHKPFGADAAPRVGIEENCSPTVVCNFSEQIKELREALKSQPLPATPYRNYDGIVSKYRRECNRLRHRLTESSNACDLLRGRLEELAEFLEQLLEVEDHGIIDLSKLTGITRTTLHKSLNDSRALSQTLSQSLLEDLSAFDSSLEEDIEGETLCDASNCYESVEVSRYLNLPDRSLRTSSIAERLSTSEAIPLLPDIELRTRRIDDILVQMTGMNDDLTKREKELSEKLLVYTTTIAELQHKLAVASNSSNISTLRSSEDVAPRMSLEVACQTLLAMAPRQSVSSLPDLSASYLSSDSLSNGKMAPLIEENVRPDEINTENNPQTEPHTCDEPTSNQEPIVTTNLLSPHSGLVRSSGTSDKGSPTKSVNEIRNVVASPSESEAWSEPDRNVSLARIGLETSGLAATLDRSRSRHSRAAFGTVHSSESDTEELLLPPDSITTVHSSCVMPLVGPHCGTLMPGSAIKPSPKRRSDACEVRRLTAKLRTLEHLNETLKAELNIYQSLSLQLSPSSDPQQSDCQPPRTQAVTTTTSEQPDVVSSSDTPSSGLCATYGNASVKKPRRLFSGTEDNIVMAAPLLQEIRCLRSKLEESISNNDQLRDQLEAAVLSCSRMHEDPSQLAHITAALLNAQETLQLTRDKLSFAQRCEQVQSDRCSVAERRADEEAKIVNELRAQLKESQMTLNSATAQLELCDLKHSKEVEEWRGKCLAAETKLREASSGHEEREARLQERLSEVTKAFEESESRLREQHRAVSKMYACVQEAAHLPDISNLHSALQTSETQVLKATRDRLVLLGEKSKLQAELLSAQSQTSRLQDSLCEGSLTITLSLSEQLQQVQSTVRNLQSKCSHLLSLNTQLSKEKAQLQDKLAGYVAVEKLSNKSDITLESVAKETPRKHSGDGAGESRLGSLAVHQLQKNHALLQDDYSVLQKDYSHLQKLYNEINESEQEACLKLRSTEDALVKTQVQLRLIKEQWEEKLTQMQQECSLKLSEAQQELSLLRQENAKELYSMQQKFLQECSDKLRNAEHKWQEAEKQLQDRLRSSEQKLHQLQQQCHSKEDYMKLEGRLQEALQQLLAAEKTSIKLRSELQVLKTKQDAFNRHREGHKWDENKENLLETVVTLSPTSHRNSLSRSFLSITAAQSALSSRERQHQRVLGASSAMTSPLRHLRFSDPNLVLSGVATNTGPLSPSLTDLLERPDDDTASRRSESPDLGLGSSDNGQMSSLERVICHVSNHDSKKYDHLPESSQKLSSLEWNKTRSPKGASASSSDISAMPLELPIDVVISDRHSLPPVASGQLCAVQSHSSLASTNETLSRQVQALQERLQSSNARLTEALEQLNEANARKQSVERAICRQLTKTHQVLRRAKGNLEARNESTSRAAADRHSSLN
ncbi:LOW QUALITY PROTEIN: uncharacterized protein LOC108665304 [Hyalella azteca]|uniref:LOW QUALITY PROTEIN: uncharacterized protein LOC108665304 n=1 Tax=Hyalella azteca TaxID=294128 RepID=A0A8B7N122_HYAAZ|nr:LOW QUALITY PROTEIN: uncharacterized protein LOC108665304 [Hyalella azteca]